MTRDRISRGTAIAIGDRLARGSGRRQLVCSARTSKGTFQKAANRSNIAIIKSLEGAMYKRADTLLGLMHHYYRTGRNSVATCRDSHAPSAKTLALWQLPAQVCACLRLLAGRLCIWLPINKCKPRASERSGVLSMCRLCRRLLLGLIESTILPALRCTTAAGSRSDPGSFSERALRDIRHARSVSVCQTCAYMRMDCDRDLRDHESTRRVARNLGPENTAPAPQEMSQMMQQAFLNRT